MSNKRFEFSGPVIVYLLTATFLVALGLIINGAEITESSRLFLRISGRLAMFLLFISFGASALHNLFQAGWTAYLLRNRRYFGISTAIVLWLHFLVILSLSITAPAWFEASVPWFILYPGSATFILVGLMALSSNEYSRMKLGHRVWKMLHLVAGYTALASFVGEYVLVLYLQPVLLPNYEFVTANSPVMAYMLFSVPILLLYLRLWKR